MVELCRAKHARRGRYTQLELHADQVAQTHAKERHICSVSSGQVEDSRSIKADKDDDDDDEDDVESGSSSDSSVGGFVSTFRGPSRLTDYISASGFSS